MLKLVFNFYEMDPTVCQISANNSTPLCYSKKTRYSGIIRGRISRWMNQYSYMNGNIQASSNCSCIFVLRLNTILSFQYRASTRPWTHIFKIRLENKSRVGTPIICCMLKCLNGLPTALKKFLNFPRYQC